MRQYIIPAIIQVDGCFHQLEIGQKMKSASFKFIDLFAGLGGFHLALNRLGGQCVFAAEWQEHLRDLYQVNFNLRPEGDITLISPNDVPMHDVLAAGFPCQPFSKAGDQLGFECTKQGDLFSTWQLSSSRRSQASSFLKMFLICSSMMKAEPGKLFRRYWEQGQKGWGITLPQNAFLHITLVSRRFGNACISLAHLSH